MKQQIDLSIVIALYNHEALIKRCLNSIVNQKAPSSFTFECLIIDDGSTDNSLQVAQDYADMYPYLNIRVITKENTGLGATRNFGVTQAKGRYIWGIDADDYIRGDAFAKIAPAIADDADNCDIYFFYYHTYFAETKRVELLFSDDVMVLPCIPIKKIFTVQDYPSVFNLITAPWSRLYRRDFLIQNAIRCSVARNSEDFPLHVMAVAKAETMQLIPESIYMYHKGLPGSQTSQRGERRLEALRAIDDSVKFIKSELPSPEAWVDIWQPVLYKLIWLLFDIHKDFAPSVQRYMRSLLRGFSADFVASAWLKGCTSYMLFLHPFLQQYFLENAFRQTPGVPLLSIIVDMTGEPLEAQKYLDCLVRQNLPCEYFEVLMLSPADGDILKICTQFTVSHRNFTVIQNPMATPVGKGFQHAFSQAQGRYVCFTDTDLYAANSAYSAIVADMIVRKADLSLAGFLSASQNNTLWGGKKSELGAEDLLFNRRSNAALSPEELRLQLCSLNTLPGRKIYSKEFLESFDDLENLLESPNLLHWASLIRAKTVSIVPFYAFTQVWQDEKQLIAEAVDLRANVGAIKNMLNICEKSSLYELALIRQFMRLTRVLQAIPTASDDGFLRNFVSKCPKLKLNQWEQYKTLCFRLNPVFAAMYDFLASRSYLKPALWARKIVESALKRKKLAEIVFKPKKMILKNNS